MVVMVLAAVAMVAEAANNRFILVIDAGHGGNDAGAIGRITKEKTINLNVALAFGRLVERNCPDVKVVYTRKTDVFVPLHTRADIANRNKADLFISIHTNSLPKGRIARGLETYTLGMHRAADNLEVAKRENAVIEYEKDYRQRYQGFDPNSSESYIMFEFMTDHNMAQSVDLAKYVQKRTCAAAARQNKGVKQAGFLVLRETSMPSCLIELGFISTPDEEQFLSSDAGVGRLALGIYQAFVDYKQKHAVGLVPVSYQPQIEERVVEESRPVPTPQPVPIPQPVPTPQPIQTPQPVSTPQPIQNSQPVPTPQPVQVPQSVVEPQPVSTVEPQPQPAVPVFKVQVLASSAKLKSSDSRLKGLKDVDCYQEGGMYKYTVGASTDYNAIYQLRKSVADRFPQAFIIAFKNNEKMNVQEAIREYRRRNK